MDLRNQILELVQQANPDNPLQYVHDIVREYSLDKLNQHIMACNDCQICTGPKSIARGNANATVMIIGESPPDEVSIVPDNTIACFSEEDSDILSSIFETLNINSNEVLCINAINCWPHKMNGSERLHRAPTIKERESCRIFVEYAIKIVQPLVIITFGGVALNLFTNEKEAVTKSRGNWINYSGIPIMPTYHPGYFKNVEGRKDQELLNAEKWEFFNDIKKACLYIQEYYPDNSLLLAPIEKDG